MRNALYWTQNAALRTLLTAVRPLPLARRRAVVARATETLVRTMPPLSARARDNLRLVWPDMPAAEREALIARTARNAGRTLTDIWFNADFAAECAGLVAEGPGLATLREAAAAGRGAIVVSGHFGRWEAIRHVLRGAGLECGALYRPNNNPYYEPLFRGGIEIGGRPIIPKGKQGNRALIRHLRDGGRMALLLDQHVADGALLPFLGHPALTATAMAELALRYDLPFVPAFAPWIGGRSGRPRVVIEAPIPPDGGATGMMRAFNDRLGSWVARHPSQWHWFHRRWKGSAGTSA